MVRTVLRLNFIASAPQQIATHRGVRARHDGGIPVPVLIAIPRSDWAVQARR